MAGRLDPVIGRDEEITCRTKNNLCLWENPEWKTAIAGLAWIVDGDVDNLKDKVYFHGYGRIIAGLNTKENLKNVLNQWWR
jgi:ATP-dependent Clp protease ATP-binding subunit ClpA